MTDLHKNKDNERHVKAMIGRIARRRESDGNDERVCEFVTDVMDVRREVAEESANE